MIFPTAYETTVGSLADLRVIEKALKETIIKDLPYIARFNLVKTGDISPVFITGYNQSEELIPHFSHQLLMKVDTKQSFLFSDVRPFMNGKHSNESITEADIRNMTEYLLTKAKVVLSMAWLNGEVSAIKNDLVFAGEVYCKWLGEVISKKYGLDAKDQLVCTIAIHYYWQSLFVNEIDENTVQKFVIRTAQVTKAPATLIFQVFDRISSLSDIKSLCTAIISACENVRLHDFNLGMLLSIISNSWYGHDAKDILSVALEHPPTWCAVVYAALTERTYKSSMVARVTERLSKYGQGDAYVKSFSSYVTNTSAKLGQEELVVRDFFG